MREEDKQEQMDTARLVALQVSGVVAASAIWMLTYDALLAAVALAATAAFGPIQRGVTHALARN